MTKDLRTLHALPDCDPQIGIMLAMFENTRARTLQILDGLEEAAVDFQAECHVHTIGSLLYHLALIELDWYYVEVKEDKLEDRAIWDWFPYPVRTNDGLTIVTGESYAKHMERLSLVRQIVLDGFRNLTLEDFHHVRELDDYDVSPAWVLQHLCQHEAEHRDELRALHQVFEKSHPKE